MTGGQTPFVFDQSSEAKRFAPATQRNRAYIIDVLGPILPDHGTVLEIASGTGEHIVHFARAFPDLTWQPSDYDLSGLASIAAWSAEARLPNILPPIQLDASSTDWPIAQADVILCINMAHISPWAATEGLFGGAGRLLAVGAPLYLYGPYREAAVPTAQSNEAFDASLKERDPAWGLRHLEDVIALGAENGFVLDRRIAMPANNLSLIFRKTAG